MKINFSPKLILKLSTIIFLIVIVSVFLYFVSPNKNFQEGKMIFVEKGENINSIANKLKENEIIRSRMVFSTLIVLLKADTKLQSGAYLFKNPPNLFSVIGRLIGGKYGSESIRVTLTEGMTVVGMAEILEKKLPKFDQEFFLNLAKNKEGYLFPDTYDFYPSADTKEVYKMLTNTFQEKTKKIKEEALAKKIDFNDLIILASIIEKEASKDSRQMISGILQKRLSINMPLQVDASLTYILGKTSAELTLDDLKNDSVFNTYIHKGLTPKPICNPGLKSMEAALNPTSTQYLYFLTGQDGQMYYAKTLYEHNLNRRKYL